MRADQQKEYDSRFNERKWEIYNEFADIVSRLLKHVGNKGTKKDLDTTIRELRDFVGKLWIIGGDNVIEAFND